MSYAVGRRYQPSEKYPHSWIDAHRMMNATTRRQRAQKFKLANNTWLELHGAGHGPLVYVVRLHDTPIVMFHSDGRVVLTTGGWQTAITRDRMTACGVRMNMHQGIVSVSHGRREYVYRDGMTLRPNGTASGHGGTDPDAVRRERMRNLRRDRDGLRHERWRSRVSHNWAGGNAPEAFNCAAPQPAPVPVPQPPARESEPQFYGYAPTWAQPLAPLR